MESRSNFIVFVKSLLTKISPRLNVEVLYWFYFKKRLNLKTPLTLNEKIQWMKLYYYRDNLLIKQSADKYVVRDYVRKCGCEEILNDIYGVYDSVSEILWDKLPEKFVLKWNFGCAGNVICQNRETLNKDKEIENLVRFGKIKYHLLHAELHYDILHKKILCERFIETKDGQLPEDYKVYCFNGEAKFVLVCTGRGEGIRPKFYFFDRDWQLIRLNKQGKEAPKDFTIPKPEGIDKLFEYAECLSKPFPFVRADFYLENGQTIFGELTFTPGGGFDRGYLPIGDEYLGSLIKLLNR